MTARDERNRSRFPRRFRLKRQRLLRPLFERGRGDVQSLRSGGLVIRYRLATRNEVGCDTPLQVGFATGRALGDKPARNRVKRVMRETFRLHRHRLADVLHAQPDTLTLIVLYRGAPQQASDVIRRELPVLLDRVAERFTVKPGDA